MRVGVVEVGCDHCGQIIPVPISVDLQPAETGDLRLVATPDLADLWAHAWWHEAGR